MKLDITLPKLKYEMGKEPVNGFKAIDKYSDFKYIAKVKEILMPEQFKRIEDSFLGPALQFSGDDAHDERFSLAMELLIETIFLHRCLRNAVKISEEDCGEQSIKGQGPSGRVPCYASPMDLGIRTQAAIGFLYD
ncbi:unnamed protein product [Thlaspi arvense]|uniref:Uncharacterized protein n=1 Tax=Thlaspi arvense TaxID=13288 RepID=A0AAU9TAD0_THLAR|nr:unnamed protein product [Thlaspi arvense]